MISLTYAARTREEFVELAKWMRDEGFDSPSLSAPKRKGSSAPVSSRGEIEQEYLDRSGQHQMRMTREERESGESREEVALARLAALDDNGGEGGNEDPTSLDSDREVY
jgi:hypothetical protein